MKSNSMRTTKIDTGGLHLKRKNSSHGNKRVGSSKRIQLGTNNSGSSNLMAKTK